MQLRREIGAQPRTSSEGPSSTITLQVFQIALVLVRLDQIARRIVNANLRGFGGASRTPTWHEQYGSSMKAEPQSRRRKTATLVERAQRVMRESRKLLEEREAQLKQKEQFLEQRAMITHEILSELSPGS